MFWTQLLICKSLDVGLWQATLGLYVSNVEDVALSIGDVDNIIVTELVGREIWVQVMEREDGTQAWRTSLVLKFERRELRFLCRYEKDVQLIGGEGLEMIAGEISSDSSVDGDYNKK